MRWIRGGECWLLAPLLLAVGVACPALPDGPRFAGSGHRDPVRGGTLMLWEEARVRMLDPHVAFDEISNVLVQMLHDGLYGYDRQMRLVPRIAAALPALSEDGRTLTILLRTDARFHNGREVTAEDVVWSLERMMHPSLQSPGASYFREIEGYEAYRRGESTHVGGLAARGRHTLEVRLGRADQSFVHMLAMHFASPLPREEVERPGADMRRRPVGTGPYRFVSWDPGVRIVVERNPRYHQPGRPYLDRIVFEEGLKKDTAFLRFRNGDVDVVPRMTPADRMLIREKKWQPYSAIAPRADIYALSMNVELAPFDNVHVRRAVAFAIDRERWCRARSWGIRPAGQIVPPGVPGHDPALPNLQRFDLTEAKREMALAGYADGWPEPVTLWTSDSASARVYGALAQADLARIGIDLQLKQVSFPVYLEQTGKPKTAQMLTGGWTMTYPDASDFLAQVSGATRTEHDSLNRSFYADPWLDALLDRARVERDEEKRTAMYREANDFVAREAPWAFFANAQVPQAWQPYVRGYAPHPVYWMPVDDVWLDLPRKRIAALLGPLARDARFASLLPWGAR
ncbi:MAG: ABC transporter substrate-binding protein [Polyangiales bacterium]